MHKNKDLSMISIAHRIELKPNNKQKTYFRKAFGCARLTYNWGLAEWKRMYEAGEKPNGREIRKRFNAIKKEQFPFTYEVTKCATDQPFMNLDMAFKRFFKGLGKYPQFKKKRDNEGSFYLQASEVHLSETNNNSEAFDKIPHNESGKHQYLHFPKLGWVKMAEHIRFNYAKINNVCISQSGGKFYASFSLEITEEEYRRTHRHVDSVNANRKVGVDMGIKSALILSDGIAIENPKPLKKNQRKITRLSRQLSKRFHPKTKEERLKGVRKSNNYMKLSVRLAHAQGRVANIRRDFLHKVTTILTTHYGEIAIEDLNVKGMTKNHRLAQAVNDVSFGELRRESHQGRPILCKQQDVFGLRREEGRFDTPRPHLSLPALRSSHRPRPERQPESAGTHSESQNRDGLSRIYACGLDGSVLPFLCEWDCNQQG